MAGRTKSILFHGQKFASYLDAFVYAFLYSKQLRFERNRRFMLLPEFDYMGVREKSVRYKINYVVLNDEGKEIGFIICKPSSVLQFYYNLRFVLMKYRLLKEKKFIYCFLVTDKKSAIEAVSKIEKVIKENKMGGT